MSESKKPFIPNEIKQKEYVWMHIMGRPITSRQLLFLGLGLMISFGIVLIYSKIPIDPSDRISEISNRVITVASIPIVFLLISNKQRKGKYLNEILVRKAIHKKNASVIFNKKTQRNLKREGGGK